MKRVDSEGFDDIRACVWTSKERRAREREREEKKIREGLNRGEEERRVHKVSAIPWCWRKLSLFSSLHPSPLLDAL